MAKNVSGGNDIVGVNYELRTARLEDLKPHPKNPRKHPDALIKKLAASITEYGFTSPVLVDADMRILAGHARSKAAEKLGLETVPVIVLPFTGAKADAYCVVDNKLNELSEWDEDLLASLMTDIDAAGYDVELTGFDLSEIDALMSPKDCVEDDFDEEKEKKKVEERGGAVTQSGDIWLLGQHRLICGDSTEAETFETLMDGEHAKMSMTSPPYGVNKEYEKGGLDDWYATLRPAIKHMCRHSDVVCYNIGDMMTGNGNGQYIEPTFCYSVQMFMENGFRPIWTRIWSKKRKALSSSAPYHLSTLKPVGDTEYIAAFASENGVSGAVSEKNEIDGDEIADTTFITAFANYNYKFVKRLSLAERREFGYTSLWEIASVTGTGSPKNRQDERNHHARFPVTLPWRCLKMHSDAGDIALEPFSGTFSTGIAAEQLGRRCFAVERDASYCDIAVARYFHYIEEHGGDNKISGDGTSAEIFLLRDGQKIPIEETGVLD